MKPEVSVAIIILNWNGIEWTRKVLAQVKQISGFKITTYVVDNDSKEDEGRILQKEYGDWCNIILNQKNLGFAEGNNVAIRDALKQGHDFFLLLNNDVIFEPDFLEKLVRSWKSGVGILGPVVMNWDGETIQSAGSSTLDLWTGTARLSKKVEQKATPQQVAMVSGCCFLIHRSVVEEIGLLNPHYFAYYEETDFCMRSIKAGFKNVLVTTTSIRHFDGGSSKKVGGFQEKLLLRNRMMFVAYNGTLLQKFTVLLYVSLFYLWFRILLALQARSLPRLQGLLQGYFAGTKVVISSLVR